MATVRDMINANAVVTKLADNPNVFVTTAFKFLPILLFLTEEVSAYHEAKEKIIAEDTDAEQKEKDFNTYLDSKVELPDVQIGVNSLRNCGLTMIDIQHIHWWLVEFVDEYEE